MDEFFDKLKDGASWAKDNAEKFAREVAKRTGNAIAHTKLAFSVNEANSKVKDIYAEMGKELYAKHIAGEAVDEYFTASFEQLDKLMDEIETLNSKIAELKNSVKCPECGAFNSEDAEFCSKCGAQITEDADPVTAEDIDAAIEDAVSDDAEDDDDEEVIVINPKKPTAEEQ